MAIYTEIARRGLSHPKTAGLFARAMNISEEQNIEVPTYGIVMLGLTAVFSFVVVSLASYMLDHLAAALCMVESPVAAITVSPSTDEVGDKNEKEGLLETGPTITLVHQKPITSTIRGTFKHLVANAGRWARFRGFRIHVFNAFVFRTVASIVSGVVPNVPGQIIFIAAITGALTANLHAAWTHKVVSMPSEKTFWQRVPAKSHWKTLALPAAIETAMPYLSLYLTCGFGMLMNLHNLDHATSSCASIMFRVFAVVVFGIVCTIFLCLPASVTLIRIEASILPEDEDTIVPFDRTFGGKVMSKLVGGTGVVGFLDAWRSFNWEARRRLIKFYVKVSAISFGLALVLIHVFVLEIFVIFGPQVGKFLAQMKEQEGF